MKSSKSKIITTISHILQPKPIITGAEWVNENFYLSAESSSISGKVTLHPYQIDIVNAMTDEWTEIVVLEKSSRIGYNKMLNMAIAYFIVQDPTSILFYSPNDALSKEIAMLEIEPMIRDNTLVAERIRPVENISKRRKSIDTNMLKNFAGGYLLLLGAVSPNNFSQKTARVVIVDELSRWKDNIGGEGDGVELAKVRASDYYNGKVIVGSSPTLKHRNKIGKIYDETNMQRRHIPCPFCHKLIIYDFEDLKYKVDDHGLVIPNSVGFKCIHCNKIIKQKYQRSMDEKGKWIAEKPERKRTAGFKIWTAYGYSPKMTWVGIIKKFLDVKNDPEKLKTFTNTILGESWEGTDGTGIESTMLATKRKKYNEHYDLPDDALIITAGVDTQGDRLEMLVVAHGTNRKKWIIDYHVIFGDPDDVEVWRDLEELYDKLSYSHKYTTDHKMGITAMSIDSGGNKTSSVYAFCKPRMSKKIFAIKGANNPNAPFISKRDKMTKKNSKYKITHFQVGVNKIKDYLSVGLNNLDDPKNNYLSLPLDEWCNEDFLNQLSNEYKDDEKGIWLRKDDNVPLEVWDCYVYAESALLILDVDLTGFEKEQQNLINLLNRQKFNTNSENIDENGYRSGIISPFKSGIISGDII